MALARQKTFFYSPALASTLVAQLVSGIVEPPADTIEFADEAGGEAARELAIPLLHGMDEIQVSEAELRIRARGLEVETHSYTAVNGPNGEGVFLSLASPGLVKKVTLNYAAPVATPGQTIRLVIRSAEPQGTGFKGGVPLFGNPGMGPLGPMYGPKLPALSLTTVSSGQQVTLPSVMGSAWLIQLAEGDEPDKLKALPTAITIVSVVLDGIPQDVSVSLASPEGDLTLWSNPGLLLPSSGEQVVSFTPLAQRHLTAKLKDAAFDAAALPVSLKFRSSSAGRLDIGSKSLRALYVARPFGAESKKLRLPGDRAALVFEVPAGLTPVGNSLRLTVRPAGRERDTAGSPECPAEVPIQGLQVSQSVYAAACLPFAATGPITGARLLLSAVDIAEGVLETRTDVAGSPGEALGKPSVRKFSPGSPAWIDFDFPEPIVPETPMIWLALRTNHGTLLWFTDASGGGAPKLSLDQGRSWGSPDTPLGPAQKFLAQLVKPADFSVAPVLTLREGPSVRVDNLLAGAASKPGDFSVTTSIPSNLLAALPAEGKVEKHFDLVSVSIADAVIEDFVITYDPAA